LKTRSVTRTPYTSSLGGGSDRALSVEVQERGQEDRFRCWTFLPHAPGFGNDVVKRRSTFFWPRALEAGKRPEPAAAILAQTHPLDGES
jgi:hypothetical protein